jgi:polyhydroxyalkanoate synthesis regulator phasin
VGSSVADALQSYVNLVSGLTRATRARASATAHALLAQAGLEEAANEASERVSKLAEEILHASRANREMFEKLVAAEVNRAAARLGFARAEDVEALRGEVDALRTELRSAGTGEQPAAKKTAPAKKAPAKKAAARASAKTP